jgi:hypothetical protein
MATTFGLRAGAATLPVIPQSPGDGTLMLALATVCPVWLPAATSVTASIRETLRNERARNPHKSRVHTEPISIFNNHLIFE